jgi:putative redox protein
MKHKIKAEWQGKMKFDAVVNGHHLTMDLPESSGGEDAGPRPKPLMLAALAGCTGLDIVSLAKKMRQEVESFNLVVEGDTEDEHPNAFISMHIIYELRGKNLDPEKIEKAIGLSMERYCGVSAVYRKAGIQISHEVRILEG